MSLEATIQGVGKAARAASRELGKLSPTQMDCALLAMASALESRRSEIEAANAKDVEAALQKGISSAMVERLRIKEKTFIGMVEGIRQVVALPNPLGKVMKEWERPNGLQFRQVRVPIGVIGIIYESRPNVTVDASVLCLKTGNAVILRGGSEAFHSNQALVAALQEGARNSGIPEASVQLLSMTDREAIPVLCRMDQYIDLMIPRGGEGLIRTVVEHARMPVIKHYNGICHVYVHEKADFEMAERIIVNGKCQRPGVCNAVEAVLVDRAIADQFVPRIVKILQANHVEVRGDAATQKLGGASVKAATEADWSTEYLELILSMRVVEGLDQAIDHVERYGSHHSDAIVTAEAEAAERFLTEVDSATVYWNASTRFTDGGEFGFGAEIGISTDKIHARGPMALEELTSYKYRIVGTGQIRG